MWIRQWFLTRERESTSRVVLQKGDIEAHACSPQTTCCEAVFVCDVDLYFQITIETTKKKKLLTSYYEQDFVIISNSGVEIPGPTT